MSTWPSLLESLIWRYQINYSQTHWLLYFTTWDFRKCSSFIKDCNPLIVYQLHIHKNDPCYPMYIYPNSSKHHTVKTVCYGCTLGCSIPRRYGNTLVLPWHLLCIHNTALFVECHCSTHRWHPSVMMTPVE